MRIGLDVGGTKTDVVAVTPAGEIIARARRPSGWGAEAVVATVIAAVRDLAAESGIAPSSLASIGIGVPGQIVPGTGRVTHAVNLGIEDLDLAALVGAALGVPTTVENDVKAATRGALALRGSGRGSLAYLNLGTGVAAGIAMAGEVWRGARGAAGEIGHISIDPHGPECPCGQRGCIEAYAGGGSLARRWGEPGDLPVRDVFDAAERGDARAIPLRDGLAFGVAAAVRVLVLSADVDTVVLGGGLTALGDRMLRPVLSELETRAAASPFLRSLHLPERVDVLAPGSPAAALGAALVGASTHEQETLTRG
ncbi:ROK family protein [Microbacterium sp. TNHR37B]|uniref:ROK family protein n=1 Tax=Microbacterium sp. TNHR37B TaxID=1775956 RepID=UPI0007B2972E|nr:ROK family protein [Microbacterium sp. TNHR37B]KZE89169.1 N-acetylmannosamine kinase [Microbacterium sp. TNHR37B]